MKLRYLTVALLSLLLLQPVQVFAAAPAQPRIVKAEDLGARSQGQIDGP